MIATAVGGTALTGAAVASGIAGASMLAGGVKSFSEAAKAKKNKEEADRLAAERMADARKRLEVNVMEGLSIQKEPYEQQVLALLEVVVVLHLVLETLLQVNQVEGDLEL